MNAQKNPTPSPDDRLFHTPPPPYGTADPDSILIPTPDLPPEEEANPPVATRRLTVAELQNLFSGAPQFSVLAEESSTDAPRPSVTLPWDSNLEIIDLCDHIQIQHKAWRSATAWQHIVRATQRQLEPGSEHHEQQVAHYMPRCRERPSILSMQGVERGTTGYTTALELGVPDALHKPKPLSIDSLLDHRKRLFSEQGGLRHLTELEVIDGLLGASVTYHNNSLNQLKPTMELHTELFTKILFPPQTTNSDYPYSLQVQIDALVEILAAPSWIDFSLVEWRVRLGQILWGGSNDCFFEDAATIAPATVRQPGNHKIWLLLQILLSCELLLRLDKISINDDGNLETAQLPDVKYLNNKATTSVRWSLILARLWLENVRLEVTSTETIPDIGTNVRYLATDGRIDELQDENTTFVFVQIQGRHEYEQLSGLLYFARSLRWPNLQALARRARNNEIVTWDRLQSAPDFLTPTQYCESYSTTHKRGTHKGLSNSSDAFAVLNPSGWLSITYMSGLILPGEGYSHLLMCALLENDRTALATLRLEADFQSGFIYSGRSFWNSACIVGRVLATGKGASECAAWVSSDIMPRGIVNSWVSIKAEAVIATGNLLRSNSKTGQWS